MAAATTNTPDQRSWYKRNELAVTPWLFMIPAVYLITTAQLREARVVVLLLAVLGQVVFLASRYRTRVDVTSDQLYTLTDSTRTVAVPPS